MDDLSLVDTVAAAVTFFEDRAQVTRRATLSLRPGVRRWSLAGLGVAVDDRSLVASLPADRGRVLSARVRRTSRSDPSPDAEALRALEARCETALARARGNHLRRERAEGSLSRALDLLRAWIDALAKVPSDPDPAAWDDAWSAADQRLVRALDEMLHADDEADLVTAERVLADEALGLARRVRSRFEAVVEVQVEALSEGPATLEIVYRTPCALWRPEQSVRLVRDGERTSLEVTTWAAAWQSTGERWDDVSCRFSTARPAQAASPPLLRDDALSARRKTDSERRTVTVEARDQNVALAGLDRGSRDVSEMPGVEDGGEPVAFAPTAPTSFPSDGAPVRVELASAKVPCVVETVAWPERALAPHLRATATWKAKHPLLAGPARLLRGGELVGVGRAPFTAPGEPFELGLGVEDGVRLRRTVDDAREAPGVIARGRFTRTVRVYLSNLGEAPRAVQVVERVPVSELQEVEVTVVELSGGRFDAKEGFVTWSVELPPRGTRALALTWRVEAPSRVALPF